MFDYFLEKPLSLTCRGYIRNSRYDEPFRQSRGCEYGKRISEFDILGPSIDFREDRSRCFDAIVTHWDNELREWEEEGNRERGRGSPGSKFARKKCKNWRNEGEKRTHASDP